MTTALLAVAPGALIALVFVFVFDRSTRSYPSPTLKTLTPLVLLALVSPVVRLAFVVARSLDDRAPGGPRDSILAVLDPISIAAAGSISLLLLTVIGLSLARRRVLGSSARAGSRV